jgi:transglutaminase-like putative cysteine protease
MPKARYRISHVSSYSYDQPVTASFNEARLTPLAAKWQTPLETVFQVDGASWQYRYVDYWGTQVRVFELDRSHRELKVRATGLVEVEPELRPQASPDVGWELVRAERTVGRLGEFLAKSPGTAPAPDLAATAESLVGALPGETALAISTHVHDSMTYQPGSTGVRTSAAEAWSARRGVCQDYAHLVIGALRHVGIPARYVSGYLHPRADAPLGEQVVGESHAWVQWWAGEWVGHDPTNAKFVSDQHVTIGCGREYADVPPIKGIVAGSPVRTDLRVEVQITRLS